MDKLVSIILPTYNGADRIQKAVESVIAQTYMNWELLVIDDGSGDNTGEVVRGLLKKEPRIRYLPNETNLGLQKTLNKGLNEAKGEYIARIDDDDVWTHLNKLEIQVEFLQKNPEYVLVGTGIISVDTNGKEQMRVYSPLEDKEIRELILGRNCFLHSTVVFKRDAALAVGGYSERESARHAEDHDLWLRLGLRGKFANIPIYAVALMSRNNSVSASNRKVQAWRSLKFGFKYFKYYPNPLRQLFVGVCKFTFLITYPFMPISKGVFNKIKKLIKSGKLF